MKYEEKKEDLSCFGLGFTACSVLGRLLKWISVRSNLFVFGSCFRMLAVILFQIVLFTSALFDLFPDNLFPDFQDCTQTLMSWGRGGRHATSNRPAFSPRLCKFSFCEERRWPLQLIVPVFSKTAKDAKLWLFRTVSVALQVLKRWLFRTV